MRRSILGVLLAACAAPDGAWHQVDPDRTTIAVTGRLEVLTMPPEGDVYMEVAPGPGDEFSLAPGQERIFCVLHERDRPSMRVALGKLKVGDTVRVSGFWTAREEAGLSRHYINDLVGLTIVR